MMGLLKARSVVVRILAAILVVGSCSGLSMIVAWPLIDASTNPCDPHIVGDIPIYCDAQQVKKMPVTNETNKTLFSGCPAVEISFMSFDKPSNIEQFYSGWLQEHGWKSRTPCGGFESNVKQLPYLAFIGAGLANGNTAVQLSVGPGKLSCDYTMQP